MSKKLLPLLLLSSFLSMSVMAQDASTSKKEDIPKQRAISEAQQEIVKNNANAALKLLASERLCFSNPDKVSMAYGLGLIYSSAFINSSSIEMKFANLLEDKVLSSVKKMVDDGDKCMVEDINILQDFRKDINTRVLSTIYKLFSDNETFKYDVANNGTSNVTDMLDSRFFSDKYLLMVKPKTDVLFHKNTRKSFSQQNNPNSVFLKASLINIVAGYKNFEQCYKKFDLTEKEYKRLNPLIGKHIINAINSQPLTNMEKLVYITTGFIVADTMDNENCSYSKRTLEFMEQIDLKKL